MELVLLEKIANLGVLGDKVNVKPGYGRNYLLPAGKAVRATADNIAKFEAKRAELERAAKAELDKAQARATSMGDLLVTVAAKASDEGKLFGSVGTREIADAVVATGIALEKSEVLFSDGALREIGEYEVQVRLHTDVTVSIKVIIVADE